MADLCACQVFRQGATGDCTHEIAVFGVFTAVMPFRYAICSLISLSEVVYQCVSWRGILYDTNHCFSDDRYVRRDGRG
jgi:hypothetical protein